MTARRGTEKSSAALGGTIHIWFSVRFRTGAKLISRSARGKSGIGLARRWKYRETIAVHFRWDTRILRLSLARFGLGLIRTLLEERTAFRGELGGRKICRLGAKLFLNGA